MPSPFPGMDPWLEHSALWPDVHRNLISVCQELLVPVVAPKYYVRGEERVYIAAGGRYVEPDVFVAVRERSSAPPYVSSPEPGPALSSRPQPILFPLTSLEGESRDRYLEIRERDTHQVVTVIEILSPANKARGTPRYQQFVKKRAEVLNSESHWIEIDLLRAGTRWEAAPTGSDYCVALSRVQRRAAEPPMGEAWLFDITDPLPVIPVPLRAPDPDVALNLQDALNAVYDRAGYSTSVDYSLPAEPPLAETAAAWADALLREKQLR